MSELKKKPVPPLPEGALVASVAQAAFLLGCAPALVRKKIEDGTLQHLQLGRRILIPIKNIQALVESATK